MTLLVEKKNVLSAKMFRQVKEFLKPNDYVKLKCKVPYICPSMLSRSPKLEMLETAYLELHLQAIPPFAESPPKLIKI